MYDYSPLNEAGVRELQRRRQSAGALSVVLQCLISGGMALCALAFSVTFLSAWCMGHICLQ